MASGISLESNRPVALDDKWTIDKGRVVINGAQAIARVLLAQAAIDRLAGLRTAGYVTGYRGSPLGGVDTALWSVGKRLTAADIVFQPGVNEDIAATAVTGTQQFDQIPGRKYDGVFAAWYGKGPGVDRSGDAMKHGNYAGAHRHGGVVIFYGDDHPGKSSSVAHQSEQALAAHLIPSLYPSDVSEVISFGLLGFALSRFSGSWVAVKLVNEVAEQTATVDLALDSFAPVMPDTLDAPGPELNIKRGAYDPPGDERRAHQRLSRVRAFIRANRIDRWVVRAPHPRLGIVTSGKAYGDVCGALKLLGLDEEAAARAGISVYKVGCIWPLEPEGLAAFAEGNAMLFVVEEKRAFLEEQIASVLYNKPERPLLIGKRDEDGEPLLSATDPLEPATIASAIAGRLERLGLLGALSRTALADFTAAAGDNSAPPLKRAPYFCSGCPHNRSTRLPEGSLGISGIGCHVFVSFVRPQETLLPAQMGGEGGNWLGLAHFTETPHMFQNLGDGTYYHSGLLTIRAAVAAKVNITYKILYNDAVAMTGGQPVDGPISVSEIARQVSAEGVKRIVILSDNPSHHAGDPGLPSDVTVEHRDKLDEIQRELRQTSGCTVLIYEQTCAAEKRRRRKRGTFPNPTQRLFISKAVCEGCGDCSVQSTCVSLVPVETALGRKRAIDQSSCNKDYSCLNGFCPSFITVRGAEPRKPESLQLDDAIVAPLPTPVVASLERGFNLMVAGIGGTGVITVGAILGMAAHLEGKAMSLFDMTGLSQKNGAVFSHVHIGKDRAAIPTQRVCRGEADLILAFDIVAALAPEAADTIRAGQTRVIANSDVAPTLAFQFDRDHSTDSAALLARLRRAAGADQVTAVAATEHALAFLGDSIGTNMFLVGVAAQQGLLPVGVDAIEQAITMNGVAVGFNIKAFRLGRLYAVEPQRLTVLLEKASNTEEALPITLKDIVEHRAAHLLAYQDQALANRYRAFVLRVREREQQVAAGEDQLARVFASNYARLLAYKDEYEVARLLSRSDLHEEIARTFQKGGRISFNLAPPIFAGSKLNGRPRKREFGRWMLPVMRSLARLKGLRGTVFDPFGYTSERKMERSLVTDYERLAERVLASLSAKTYQNAVRLLGLADQIRGYGPVKAEAVARYRKELARAETATDHQEQAAIETQPSNSIVSFRSKKVGNG